MEAGGEGLHAVDGLYAVDGAWPTWLVEVSLAVAWCSAVPAAIALLTWAAGRAAASGADAGILGGSVIAIGSGLWVHVLARARSGRVEFHEAELRFLDRAGKPPRMRIPWAEILHFTDRDAESVHVTWRRDRLPLPLVRPVEDRKLRIPTPTEADRVAVLTVLDRHGIRRRD